MKTVLTPHLAKILCHSEPSVTELFELSALELQLLLHIPDEATSTNTCKVKYIISSSWPPGPGPPTPPPAPPW